VDVFPWLLMMDFRSTLILSSFNATLMLAEQILHIRQLDTLKQMNGTDGILPGSEKVVKLGKALLTNTKELIYRIQQL